MHTYINSDNFIFLFKQNNLELFVYFYYKLKKDTCKSNILDSSHHILRLKKIRISFATVFIVGYRHSAHGAEIDYGLSQGFPYDQWKKSQNGTKSVFWLVIFDGKCRKKCYALTQWKPKPLYKAKAWFFLNLMSKKILKSYIIVRRIGYAFYMTKRVNSISFPQFWVLELFSASPFTYLLLRTSLDVSQSLSQWINTAAAAAAWLTRASWTHCLPNPSTCYYSPAVITARTEPSPPRSAKPINRRILHARRPVIISCKHHVGRNGATLRRGTGVNFGAWGRGACPQQILEWWWQICDSSTPRFLL